MYLSFYFIVKKKTLANENETIVGITAFPALIQPPSKSQSLFGAAWKSEGAALYNRPRRGIKTQKINKQESQ